MTSKIKFSLLMQIPVIPQQQPGFQNAINKQVRMAMTRKGRTPSRYLLLIKLHRFGEAGISTRKGREELFSPLSSGNKMEYNKSRVLISKKKYNGKAYYHSILHSPCSNRTEDGRCICRIMFIKLKGVVFFLKISFLAAVIKAS